MSAQPTPEVKNAIVKGAIVEAIVLALGMGLFAATQNAVWIVGSVVLGSGALLFFIVQAGAFDRRDE